MPLSWLRTLKYGKMNYEIHSSTLCLLVCLFPLWITVIRVARGSEERHRGVEWCAQSHAVPKVLSFALETLSFLLPPDATVTKDHHACLVLYLENFPWP